MAPYTHYPHTARVIFEPEDFIARLAALVPGPRAHLIRHHGAFAPASLDRARVVPKTRGAAANQAGQRDEPSATDRQWGLTWAQRRERVFAIDIQTCRQCGSRLRLIASIEKPAVIERILGHLGCADSSVDPAHPSRAPPGARGLSDDRADAPSPRPPAPARARADRRIPCLLFQRHSEDSTAEQTPPGAAQPGSRPQPAIARPLSTRLDRFRCSHKAADTSYPPQGQNYVIRSGKYLE